MNTPDEFAAHMLELSKIPDLEDRHIAMDGLMMRTLRMLGYNDGVDIFCNTEMWYS